MAEVREMDAAAMTPPPPRRKALPRAGERRFALAALLAGVAVWLLTHAYVGVSSDGSLYTLMAINWIHPGVFGSDLFVLYGSQDRFSLFSPIYGSLIGWFGILPANIALLLFAEALWLAGAWLLAHRLLRGGPAHIAFLLMCAIQPGYGGWSMLYAGENFLTARPLAEALVMLGVAALLRGARIRSAAAFLLALAIHPIMALPGLGVAFLAVAARRRAVLLAVPVGTAAVLVLSLAGVEPFGHLLVTMDPVWLAAVRARDAFQLTGAWAPGDWSSLVADLTVCAAAALCAAGARRTVFVAVVLTALGGVALSALGGDIAHNALITQLQVWRCGWLLAVVKLPALVLLWARLRRRPLGGLACALLTAPLLLLTLQFKSIAWIWAPAAAMSVAGCALACLVALGRQPRLPAAAVRCLLYLVAVLPAVTLAASLGFVWVNAQFRLRHGVFLADEFTFLPVRLALLAAAIAIALAARRRPWIAAAGIAILFAGGVAGWDARTPWDRYVVSGRTLPMAAQLPPRAQILWSTKAGDTWFLLRRPAYVSMTQATGLLFYRGTAMEWMRRRDIVWPVLPMGDWSQGGRPLDCKDVGRPVERARVEAVCRRAAGLEGVILSSPVAGAQTFTTPAAEVSVCAHGPDLDTYANNRFYYLTCKPPA